MARPNSLRRALATMAPLARRFAPHLRKERRLLAGGSAALFFEVGMRLLEPWPIKLILDRFTGHEAPGVLPEALQDGVGPLVLFCALAVVTIALGQAVAAYTSTVAFALAGNRVLTRVRHELFLHLHRLQGRFHDHARGGDLVVRVIGDVGLLKDVMVTALLPLVGNALILVGMLLVMAWLDLTLTLLALSLLPLFALRMVKLGGRIRKASQTQRRREGALASTAAEAMGAMETVQALGLEGRFADAFASEGNRDMKEGVKAKRLQARLERSVDVLVAASTALVLAWGGWRMFEGLLSPGDLVVFLAYLKNAFKPMKSMAKYTARISKAAAAADRVMELLDTEPEVTDRPGAVTAPAFRGDLRFEGVRFSYPGGGRVLDGADLHLGAGERVALVGPSGTGKSTVVAIMLRLREPEAGQILLDDLDPADFTLASVRQQVAVLLQEPILFAATLRENIACGAEGVTDEEVRAAAQLARADHFIMRLPGGYDAEVGERGVTLSRGERQRIAIARLAVRQAPYLVLDEPTTGLDPANRALVIEALESLARDRTTLVITHDMELAARMDRVLHLVDGRIHEMEAGAHALPV